MIAGLLLAAGSSSRLGQPKQLVRIQGRTLLANAIQALTATDKLLVVLGFNSHLIAKEIPTNVAILVNPNWERGIGNSIKAGIASLLKDNPDLTGVLISVCDQPYLSATHISELITVFNKNPDALVCSSYAGTVGVPALFPSSAFSDLQQIRDEQGARNVILKHIDQSIQVPFESGMVDIDTPEDLEYLSRE